MSSGAGCSRGGRHAEPLKVSPVSVTSPNNSPDDEDEDWTIGPVPRDERGGCETLKHMAMVREDDRPQQ